MPIPLQFNGIFQSEPIDFKQEFLTDAVIHRRYVSCVRLARWLPGALWDGIHYFSKFAVVKGLPFRTADT